MTESEAIKILQRDLEIQVKNKALPDGIEAIQIAIQALEKQIEMKKYCDENGCADCLYHNTSLKDNRCMNDFIIDRIDEE